MAIEGRGAKPYKPLIIGVRHTPAHLPETLEEVRRALRNGGKSVGLEVSEGDLKLLQSGGERPEFFSDVYRVAKEAGSVVHAIDSGPAKKIYLDRRYIEVDDAIKTAKEIYRHARAKRLSGAETLKLAKKFEKEIAIAYGVGPLRNRIMLRKTLEKKPDVIVAGGVHAKHLAGKLGVRLVSVGPKKNLAKYYDFVEKTYRGLKEKQRREIAQMRRGK
ncbi:MAG: hypothetical protein WC792_04670 [Candidatus Micrarchaeia archaeon]|jgi:hypothetical protein